MRALGSICYTTSTLYVTKRNSVFPDVGDVIKQCQSIAHQQTGASFVAMVTYMQVAIQCQR